MSKIATPYEELLRKIMKDGEDRDDRTGTGARTIFGMQMEYDISESFPLLTTKRVPFKLIASELLWFLSGSSNIRPLLEQNNHIWDEWPFKHWLLETGQISAEDAADSNKLNALTDLKRQFTDQILSDEKFAEKWGELGPVYGYQWRHWPDGKGGEIDQISRVLEQIKKKRNDRRMIVSAWNVADIDEMAISGLPPCHTLFQFDISQDGRLSSQLYQRSCDAFLGVPFNIASYSLLTVMMAQQAGLKPG
ncbi:MAG: thymidylate synthase, partial [Candidatus Nomurabacteria bacterium]|nr:thymidylate synthase [Candidatus Nomurabacteria bacterium]